MYLPNVESVIIDPEKIEGYVLNEQHSEGKNKAVKIRQETGLTASDAPWVRAQIAEKIQYEDAVWHSTDGYGCRYHVTIEIEGWHGSLTVQTAWIIREGENVPRFTTLVPRKPRGGRGPP